MALVTGGSGALGRAICLHLARRAHAVAVHYHRDASAAERVVQAIEREGGTARIYCADLNQATAAADLVSSVLADFGHIDVLVNGVGITRDALLYNSADEDIRNVIALNLESAFHVTRAVMPAMLQARRGAIVNVSSTAASRPRSGQAAYVASKAGLEGFTRAMAIELGSKGIRVNAVAPGIIVSDMTEHLRSGDEPALLRAIALRRFGQPDDVATAVCFLASADSGYITGHVLHVDGGRQHGFA